MGSQTVCIPSCFLDSGPVRAVEAGYGLGQRLAGTRLLMASIVFMPAL